MTTTQVTTTQVTTTQVELSKERQRREECENILKGLLPEVYCLYREITKRRLDRNYDDSCIVHRKYKTAREYFAKWDNKEDINV